MENLIGRKEFIKWMENRVTVEFLSLIAAHRDANEELINKSIKFASRLSELNLQDLEQYRGQMFALENVLDVETFMSEKLEREKPIDEQIQI